MEMTRKIAAFGFFVGISVGAAYAQSNVKMYGTIDAFVGRVQASGEGKDRSAVESSGLTTSYWGVSGREALGNGLNVDFALESFFRTDSGQIGRYDGDTFWGRNAYVGLSGEFGSVKIGRNTTPWFVSMLLFNPLADSAVFSPMFLQTYTTPPGAPVANTIAGDTNWDNSVLYQSPQFGGFQFSTIYAFGENSAKHGKQNFGGNVTYFNNKFSATFAIQRIGVDAPEFIASGASKQTSYLAGAAYDFGFMKLFGSYAQSSNRILEMADWKNKTMQIGSSIPLGSGVLMAEWARTRQAPYASEAKLIRNTATVAYNHPISKRTDIYAAWRYDKVSGLSSGNTMGVGLRHRF